ncbi:unnamed protein product [Diatraea saccharalis]|uniref:Uncharacterized protein n=1 Tax=Diatraea saccharalis TaxID=40085 RepID=A0A9N9RGH6_9NEOP|nr:unnamed protein product [Diatraea saccharalis]
MSNICRFCFFECNHEMQELTEGNKICLRIQSCIGLKIEPLKEPLPTKICKTCSEKVDELYDFHRRITESENILLHYLYESKIDLDELYFKLKNSKLKDETNVQYDVNENTKCLMDEVKLEDKSEINDDSISNDEPLNFEISPLNDITLDEKKYTAEINENPELITQFKCLTCFKTFEYQNLLLSHYNMEHNKKNKGRNIKDNFKIISSSNGTLMFGCTECNKEYENKKSVIRHLRAHVNERPFICKLCGRTYKTASEIVRHSRAHNGTRLFCSQQCGYSTVYLGALKEHEKRHNKTEFKYKCEKCDKGFQVKTWYEQHQNVHTGSKPFVCDICGATFHMDRESNIVIHTLASDLVCSEEPSITDVMDIKEHGINSYILCDLCGKTLVNNEQLKLHKRMHLGDKPFTCSTCNKSFTKKFNLQLHERSHTGLKSYTCIQCGKHYSQQSTLRRHMQRWFICLYAVRIFNVERSYKDDDRAKKEILFNPLVRHHSTEQLKCHKCIKTFSSHHQYISHKRFCI